MQYWTLQRYLIMREYTSAAFAPPPLSLLWNLALLIYLGVRRRRIQFETDPFMCRISCIVGDSAVSEEQLTKWEGLRSQEFLRRRQEGQSAAPASECIRPGRSPQLQLPSQSAAGTTENTASAVAAAAAAAAAAAQSMDWDTMHSVVRVRIREVSRTPRSSCVELT
uniref:Uncharacterized protein n=1 Tax=Macrostomum lignano TaxID=282301 RepID=A0A1I8FMV9_9PLAT